MKILIVFSALVLAASADDVRLIDLDPPEAQQIIDSKDTSLKYAPKIESNVPAVRYLGNEPHQVVEDIYLANQYHGQDGVGGYLYGYAVPDIAKTEKKKPGGDLTGAYNYVNGQGQEIKVEYWDNGQGFHQIDNVPKILPKQIPDSPEVQAAKDEHARIWAAEAERNSKPIQNPYPSAQPGAYAGLGAGVGAGQQTYPATTNLGYGGQGGSSIGSQTGGIGAGQQGGSQGGFGSGSSHGGSKPSYGQGGFGQGGAGQGGFGGSHGGAGQQGGYQPGSQGGFGSGSSQGGSKPSYGQGGFGQGGAGQQGGFGGSQGGSSQGGSGGSHGGSGQGGFGGSQGGSSFGGGGHQGGFGGSGSGQGGFGSAQGGYGSKPGLGQQGGYQVGSQGSHGSNKPNHIDYSGQYSENSQSYASNPQQKNQEEEEPQGPPKGFFYNFDYPVGIITSTQGQQKRESLSSVYNTNKQLFEEQLKGGAAVHGGGSYPSYQVHA